MTIPKFQWLPAKPDLDFLRREARTLRKQHRDRVPEICQMIGHFDTSLHGLSSEEIFEVDFSILDAQRVIARKYSFASWRRMKFFVEEASSPESGWDHELRREVLQLEAKTEAVVEEAEQKQQSEFQPDSNFNALRISADVLARKAIDRHGWPGPGILGGDGSLACGLAVAIADTADTHLAGVQNMQSALKSGKVYGRQYAAIADYLLFLAGENLAFGMMAEFDEKGEYNFSKRVVEPEYVDKRRARIGLSSLTEAREQFPIWQEDAGNTYTPEKSVPYWSYYRQRGGYDRLDLSGHRLHVI